MTYSYTYDRLHRLVSETNDGPSDNFMQATLVSTYNDQYRPLHAPAIITYNGSERYYIDDPNGNLTGIPDFRDPFYNSYPKSAYNSITYNADNMPVSIENRKDDGQGGMPSVIAVDFIYDGNGTRAKKADSTGNTTYYIGDHFEVANGEEVKYIFAGNQRIAKITTGNSYFYHKDHLGSSSVMTDYPAGATVETTEYLPFGHERDHTGTDVTDYKFTDQEKDTETGLYNYDARMYDPVIALFISADSVDQDWYDPQKLNRYAYARNNPLKYIDPTGHYDDKDNHDLGSGGSKSDKELETDPSEYRHQQYHDESASGVNYTVDIIDSISYVNEIPVSQKSEAVYQEANKLIGQEIYTGKPQCNFFVQDTSGKAGIPLGRDKKANEFETYVGVTPTDYPVRGDMIQFDKGGRDDPSGHVAIYSGMGKMISSSSKRVDRFGANAKSFGITEEPVKRFLRYNR